LSAQPSLNQSETVCVTLKRFRAGMRQERSEAEMYRASRILNRGMRMAKEDKAVQMVGSGAISKNQSSRRILSSPKEQPSLLPFLPEKS